MDLLPVIRKLLYSEEGLIIPGLGGFLSQYKPAEIHPQSGTFIPPSKSIIFNPDLRQRDETLARHVATLLGITKEEARYEVERFVRSVWEQLGRGERFPVEGVGFFYLDPLGTVRFQVDTGTNLLLDSFGFAPFYLNEIKTETDTLFRKSPLFRQEEEEPVKQALPGTEFPREKNRTVRRLVFTLPLLLLMVFLPYNSRISRTLVVHPSTLAPEPSLFRIDYPQWMKKDTVTLPLTRSEELLQELQKSGD